MLLQHPEYDQIRSEEAEIESRKSEGYMQLVSDEREYSVIEIGRAHV